MRNKFLLVCFLLLNYVFGTALISTPRVFAQESGVQLQDATDVEITLNDKILLKDGSQVQDVFNSTDDMLNLLVKVVFVGAGMFLFFMIVGAGFAMIQGGGEDKGKAKTTMTSALTGLIVMLAAYWIMQIIQLVTGINMGF
jgi:hypothetical protein